MDNLLLREKMADRYAAAQFYYTITLQVTRTMLCRSTDYAFFTTRAEFAARRPSAGLRSIEVGGVCVQAQRSVRKMRSRVDLEGQAQLYMMNCLAAGYL